MPRAVVGTDGWAIELVRSDLAIQRHCLTETQHLIQGLTELELLLLASAPRLVHQDRLPVLQEAATRVGIQIVTDQRGDEPAPWVWIHTEGAKGS